MGRVAAGAHAGRPVERLGDRVNLDESEPFTLPGGIRPTPGYQVLNESPARGGSRVCGCHRTGSPSPERPLVRNERGGTSFPHD